MGIRGRELPRADPALREGRRYRLGYSDSRTEGRQYGQGAQMRNLLVSGLFVLAACGGSSDNGITNPPPPKKPDPYITVRIRNLMDTTTAPGRAHWHIYAMLSGPDTAR